MLEKKTPYTTQGSAETMFEVRCPLTLARKRRSVDVDDRVDVMTWGYYISVSNDGITFSEEDAMVVFDSTCLNCIVTGSTASCEANVSFLQYIYIAG